jgi:hypothetical protein
MISLLARAVRPCRLHYQKLGGDGLLVFALVADLLPDSGFGELRGGLVPSPWGVFSGAPKFAARSSPRLVECVFRIRLDIHDLHGTGLHSTHGRVLIPEHGDIPYEPWRDTCSALHLFAQMVGKHRLARTPWVKQGKSS